MEHIIEEAAVAAFTQELFENGQKRRLIAINISFTRSFTGRQEKR